MTESLSARYDGLVCDLDGVVYAGPSAIPHAVESLNAAHDRGMRIVYATNNASRPGSVVAAHLRGLGVHLDDGDVINSSMAAAELLTEAGIAEGSRILAVGGEGVALALEGAGYLPVTPASPAVGDVVAVVQGYGPEVRASDLAAAAYAIQAGARWFATNTDLTLPTDRGIAPGNGSLIAAVRNAVGSDPDVAGKPMPVMYDAASRLMGVPVARVLAIGDRLETDVEGANRGGYDSVLVLTGVHGLADAAAAAPLLRPTYVIADLRELDVPYEIADRAPRPEGSRRVSGRALPEARRLLLDLWAKVDAGELSAAEARHVMEGAYA